MPELLEMARSAFQRHEWKAVLDNLASLESVDDLGPDDLMMHGDSLWWSGEPDQAIEVFEHAFSAFVDAGRPVDAARVGGLLAYLAIRRNTFAVAGGWISRVEQLLVDQPESPAHVFLKVLRVGEALFVKADFDGVMSLADEAMEQSRRVGAPGMEALAMSFKGMALIQKGEWRAGVSLIDQSTVVAMSEKADLRAASDVYCNTIAACSNLGDYRRAAEWTDQAERWMSSNAVTGYTGVCQVHRAELKRLRGSWTEAEEDARRACVELERFHLTDGVGDAYYEIGEVRRALGDHAGAGSAYQKAYEYGNSSLPGRALLMMEMGDVENAAKTINSAVARRTPSSGQGGKAGPSRGRLLPAQAKIAMAASDNETAQRAVAELEALAGELDGRSWAANALTSRGALELFEGNWAGAIDALGAARKVWLELDLVYESAVTRVMLGQAHAALGDRSAAEMEWSAARAAFKRFGAVEDLRRLDALDGGGAGSSPVSSERVMMTFMFTDIVTSTDLVGLIGDDDWQDLLEWHDTALRQEIASSGGREVRHTGDGLFATFSSPRAGVDCAVAIQRRLSDHRRASGFAPKVRIGLHVAEATRRGDDFAGHGVHVAARVAALAGGDEIVVSSDLVARAGAIPYPLTAPEEVALKGVTDMVSVSRVDWRQ